ncbi:hypothetical protein GCM10010168_73900 [Actinoplanes ianthinogenes]|uniref:Uncharacterized protein n=1 Tax=Actinoplanes ianthinogenes TaxID=122358 RepID=A0ABM7LN29_9ACTN|nr:hypothetical protein Aiant_12790 [Actinoplanes ianthinogenes]GGR44029.1 hypothetical protein GCM10010168_73900 [Actinoplanes ianthinogenes]
MGPASCIAVAAAFSGSWRFEAAALVAVWSAGADRGSGMATGDVGVGSATGGAERGRATGGAERGRAAGDAGVELAGRGAAIGLPAGGAGLELTAGGWGIELTAGGLGLELEVAGGSGCGLGQCQVNWVPARVTVAPGGQMPDSRVSVALVRP